MSGLENFAMWDDSAKLGVGNRGGVLVKAGRIDHFSAGILFL